MSLFRYMFDNDFIQRADIERLGRQQRGERSRRRRTDADQDRQIAQLEEEVDELQLLVSALVQILSEDGVLDGERLRAAMVEIGERREAEVRAREEAEAKALRAKAPTRSRRKR